ncbi:ATP-binding protein [Mesorhizobium sp. M0933]|uniref:hypothetical protein n=1 Tax=Mesorhizobium sp. M0933 TaxID=2957030 RepID=UPI00333CF3AF
MLEKFDLKHDPFPIVPDGPVHNWAGRQELKLDLIDIIKGVRGRDIGITEFVVVHGEYGAGKSHALRYLKTMIAEKADEFNSLALYVERPRVSSKLNFLELTKYVVKVIGRENIRAYCSAIKVQLDKIIDELAAAAGIPDVKNRSSFYETAINQFPADDQNMIKLLARGSADEGKGLFLFLSGAERNDGDEYEGKIDSDFVAAKVLSDLFRVLISEIRPGVRILESVYLFIDEAEILAEAKASESELVFNGLRELINGLPYRFGLVISFSAATALIEAIMPQHLLKRMTRPYIEIPMLNDIEAVEFLQSQINFARTAGSQYSGDVYPFTMEAIEFIVQNTTTLTPRNLFIDCKRVLERSLRRFELEPGERITEDMAEKILQSYR